MTFSMPMTVISVSRQRQAHPPVALGLHDHDRAGLGHREVGAGDGDLGAQEPLPQVQPGRLGESRGSVVSPSGRRARLTHLAPEDLADLGAIAVDGGHQDVRRPVATQLDDQLGQIGLVARMPASASASLRPISWVAIDLTLTTSLSPVACTRPVTMRLASAASAAQCTCSARGRDRLLQLQQIAVEVAQGVALDRCGRPPAVPPNPPVRRRPPAACPGWWRSRGAGSPQLGVGERGRAPPPGRPVCRAIRRCPHRSSRRPLPWPAGSRPGASCRRPARCR